MLAVTTPSQEAWIIGGIFAVIIAIGGVAVWMDRARRKGIAADLRAAGFDVREGDREFDPVDDAIIADNPLVLYTRNKVRWSATGERNGNVVRLYEYYFTTGYGRSRRNHYFLFAATDLPANVAEFTLQRKRWFMTHRPGIKSAPAPTSDPFVGSKFACYARDSSGAAAMLSPAVCQELATWDKKLLLRFADGTLLVGRRGLGKMREINETLDRLDRVFNAALAAAAQPSGAA